MLRGHSWVLVAVLVACGHPGDGADGEDGAMAAAADPSADPAGDPPGGACDGEVHTGEATYYGADGSGNCSFAAAPGDPLVAAMNDADYAASAACGACVEIDGPDASITVRI